MSNPLDHAVMLMQEDGVNYANAMRAFERLFIIRTLERHKGCQTKAAAEMGMHRNTLHRKIAELLIDPKPALMQQASDEYERSQIGHETEGAA